MKRVGIICGGFSSEYDISVKSANTILKHFPEHLQGVLIEINQENWRAKLTIENQIDAAIVYTHGNPGENGLIQAYLEMLQIPFVNSGVLSSALSFDKWYCNQFLKGFGFEIAQSKRFLKGDIIDLDQLIGQLGLPLFIKPTDSGSSFGISKVKSPSTLDDAIAAAFKEGNSIVAEQFLNGTEVTCGVFKSRNGIKSLPLTEIVSETDFFDYAAKYQGKSQEITPARISEAAQRLIEQKAKEIYSILNLRSIARIDFMLVNEVPFVIEVNTTPGFSDQSIVPKMIEVAGMEITEFWKEIISVELGM